MKGDINIAVNIAPKEWTKFRRWHKLACSLDNLSAEERWVKMGNQLPKKDDNKRTKEKK
jgi:hypothetical protein